MALGSKVYGLGLRVLELGFYGCERGMDWACVGCPSQIGVLVGVLGVFVRGAELLTATEPCAAVLAMQVADP